MDTSKKFIKMCDCPEIQELRPPKEFFKKRKTAFKISSGWDLAVAPFSIMVNGVWLPTQGQLQEMIAECFDHPPLDGLHAQFLIFIDWFNALHGDYRIREARSYEQLWLAFVMKERWNKVWNGSEWEVIMCTHKFIYPEDLPQNYNPDGRTITGRCRCGATQISNGRRYMIEKWEHFLEQIPYGATEIKFIDKVLR